ncbi:MAG TPA: cation:proton antiporter [Acidimicrobiia bacterium]|nr:cation:proton antiporter [Acidimicrobiia bacterium]
MTLAAAADTDTALVLIELGAVVLGLALLARASNFVGVSPIPAYVVAGLAVGTGGLVDLAFTEEFIALGAEIGVVLLLLTLGFEYSAQDLWAAVRASLPVGFLDLVLNFPPGVVAGLAMGWGFEAAFLLGGITYISSSGVVAKTLRDLGRLGNRETPAVLSVLVLEDLAMAVYLPLVAVMLADRDAATGAVSIGVALLAVGAVLLVAFRFGDRLSRLIATRSDEVLLLTIFGTTLLVAGLAQRMQVSAAVGAFLVGIALSGPLSERAASLIAPLRDLFSATFFLFFSLQVDPADLPAVLGVAIALAAVTAATKVATGWWAAARIGVGRRGRARAGASLVARGEFSIVIAALGVAAGAEVELGAVAAAYVLILAIVGPVLARYADDLAGSRSPATPAPAGTSTYQ